MSASIFSAKNIFNNRIELKSVPIINITPHSIINEMHSIENDMEIIATGSNALYKNIDKSNKTPDDIKSEFLKFYNNINTNLREMADDLVESSTDNLRAINNIASRSSNQIQKYIDHINNKPDDYTYRAESFRYTLSIPVLLSDLIEIRKNIDINRDTNIIDRYNTHFNRISNPNYMDLIRGSIANRYGTTINADEFMDTLYMSFRNGQEETEAILFTKQDLLDSCEAVLSTDSTYTNIETEVKKINSEINAILDMVNDVNRSEFVVHLDDEGKSIFYSYMYNKLMELVEVFTIIRIAVSVLIEAYTEAYSSRLDLLKCHYNSNGVVVDQPNNILESINNVFFLYELDKHQNNIVRYISEGSALSKDGKYIVNELKIVHENYADKMKASLGRLMKRIKNLWDKFIERANSLIQSDSNYLKKYKNIITQKPMKDRSYEMYDFSRGVKLIDSAKPPRYNFNMLEASLGSDEDFIDKHFRQYMKKDLSFTDSCKLSFRGSDQKKSIHSSNLNLEQMYDFCINYKKRADAIKNEMSEIEKAGNEAIKSLEIRTVNTESSAYSVLREQVFYEADGDDKPESATVSKTNTGTDRENKAIGDANKANDNDIAKNMVYMSVCQNFLGAKMTVLQEIYKGYMFIIREHIRDYTGVRNTDKDNKSSSQNTTENDDAKGAKNNFLS